MLEKALQISHLTPNAWFGKGDALSQLKRYDEALACFDKCIQLDPSNVAAWNNKGATLVVMGRYEDALSCYDEAIKKLQIMLCRGQTKQKPSCISGCMRTRLIA